jgi:hypothetical protein
LPRNKPTAFISVKPAALIWSLLRSSGGESDIPAIANRARRRPTYKDKKSGRKETVQGGRKMGFVAGATSLLFPDKPPANTT